MTEYHIINFIDLEGDSRMEFPALDYVPGNPCSHPETGDVKPDRRVASMVRREKITQFIALLVIIGLAGSVQAQGSTGTEAKSGYIEVGLYPYADFSANPVSGAPPLAVAFTDMSGGSTPRTYQWSFGDGGTSTAASPAHTYTTAGIYTVTLTITNSYGTDSETKAEYIRVGVGPVADFGATPLSGNLPLAVTFRDMSTGNPNSWSWTFGDGGTSTAQNPSHTYTKAGTYGVTLTVTNAFGRSTKTRAGYITTGLPPTADFTSGARTGAVPLTVMFMDASAGRPTSWSWNFGDGTTSTQQNPSHTYTGAGTYAVTLTARNAYGADSETKAGFVTAGAKPDAEFTADQRIGTAPLTVRFSDLSTGNPVSWAWNFGDGTTSTEQNPTHVYNLEGSYDVTLTATNSYGSDTETKTGSADTCVGGLIGYIIVGRVPSADFSADRVSGSPPLAVAFTDRSSGATPRTYQWSFGDGGTSTETNPAHTYSAAGVYAVTLTVANAFGVDSETKAEYIRVGAGPVADFSAIPKTGLLPLAVAFQDQSAGSPATWRWDFGDGSISADRNPSHTYTKAGTYGVTLTVTNAFGRSTKTRAGYITTGMQPIADFTSGARAGAVPLAVMFTDASKGGPTSWSWEFGDGSTSTAVSPAHTYTKAGTYTVILTVRNAYGSDSETKASFVTAGSTPSAEFAADPRIGGAPLSVKFTDLSTGSPSSWKWDFGDGTSSAEQNPVHVYQEEGSYDVTLTVTNSYGTDTEKKTGSAVTSAVGGASGYIIVGRVPFADFTASPVSGAPPLAVAFTDRSTGATPLSYQWSFGDGGTSTAASPTHSYAAAGVYTVALTITNAYGADTETRAELIRVGAGPVADFAATPQSGLLPLAVAFQDLSAGSPATWRWDFGDGGTSADRNPSHTYARAGTYGVTLTVTNAFGRSTKTRAGYITAGMPPTADFTSGARAGAVPLSVKFTDASKGGPASWSWDFGDGGTSTAVSPAHTYTKAGTYTVTLTVRNAYGSDSETKAGFVTAGGKPDADFTADERRGVKPFTVKFTDLSTGSPTSWKWDFGDGTSSAEQNPVHVYQEEGSYDVTLTVTNSYGSDTEKKTGASPLVTPPMATPPGAAAPGSTVPGSQAATTAGTQPGETQMPGFEGILAISGLAVLVILAERH
jgi:PKD repeat protein